MLIPLSSVTMNCMPNNKQIWLWYHFCWRRELSWTQTSCKVDVGLLSILNQPSIQPTLTCVHSTWYIFVLSSPVSSVYKRWHSFRFYLNHYVSHQVWFTHTHIIHISYIYIYIYTFVFSPLMELGSIVQFLRHKCVFVTGSTGFLANSIVSLHSLFLSI